MAMCRHAIRQKAELALFGLPRGKTMGVVGCDTTIRLAAQRASVGFNMNSVNRMGAASPIQKIVSNPVRRQVSQATASNLTDKLELSGLGHFLTAIKSNDVRTEKVAAIKAQIESGKYESDTKMDVATDKLLDELLRG